MAMGVKHYFKDGTEYKGYKLRFEPGNRSSKTKVFISNLPDDADEHEVEQLCSRAGTAFGCRLIRTADGKCKNHGFVFCQKKKSIHTCMHTYMHTCLNTYLNTHVRTNMHACRDACMCVCVCV